MAGFEDDYEEFYRMRSELLAARRRIEELEIMLVVAEEETKRSFAERDCIIEKFRTVVKAHDEAVRDRITARRQRTKAQISEVEAIRRWRELRDEVHLLRAKVSLAKPTRT